LAGPTGEGTAEARHIGELQMRANGIQRQVAMAQQMFGGLLPRFIAQLAERDAFIGQTAAQRGGAEAEHFDEIRRLRQRAFGGDGIGIMAKNPLGNRR
jgi:hypothetical protein